MPGRILIADDRFASRLMLAALFGGAYYEVVQADRADRVLPVARAERPGVVVISDGMANIGAAALCESLRRDPATTGALRVVMTDRVDSARAAVLIGAGADDVIARSCRDEEVLARLRTLIDHRARVRELSLRDVSPRPQGMAEPAPAFVTERRIAILSPRAIADKWRDSVARALPLRLAARVDLVSPEAVTAHLPDVLVLDSEGLGTDATLRLVAQITRETGPGATQLLIAAGNENSQLVLRALDLGADGILPLPFTGAEAAARIGLLVRRREEIAQLHQGLRIGLQSAMTDPLTGLYNRRYTLPRLDNLLRDVTMTGRPVALLMVDLDHFKRINDCHGHPAGDAVLCAVAKVLGEATPSPGFAARMGGEEFLIVLPDCDRAAATTLAQRIRSAIADLVVPYPGCSTDLKITASIGIAVIPAPSVARSATIDEETARHLARADRALYRAKRAGRNRVVCDLDVVETEPELSERQVQGG